MGVRYTVQALVARCQSNVRCLDNHVFAFAKGIPDAIVKQVWLIVNGNPRNQNVYLMASLDGINKLRHLDFKRPNDRRWNWLHFWIVDKELIVGKAHVNSGALIGVHSQ